jgi:hypothetical protein
LDANVAQCQKVGELNDVPGVNTPLSAQAVLNGFSMGFQWVERQWL